MSKIEYFLQIPFDFEVDVLKEFNKVKAEKRVIYFHVVLVKDFEKI